MSMYRATVPQYKKMLSNLDRWLEKATAFAQQKNFDPNVLLNSRLAPDQFPLVRQIQSACDNAKFGAARLTGKTPPSHPDNEQTMEEIRARIATVIAYLDTFREEDFAESAGRVVPLNNLVPGKAAVGADYLNELALPNFYFHLTHAYAILRHNGVDLGKRDYLGTVNLRDL